MTPHSSKAGPGEDVPNHWSTFIHIFNKIPLIRRHKWFKSTCINDNKAVNFARAKHRFARHLAINFQKCKVHQDRNSMRIWHVVHYCNEVEVQDIIQCKAQTFLTPCRNAAVSTASEENHKRISSMLPIISGALQVPNAGSTTNKMVDVCKNRITMLECRLDSSGEDPREAYVYPPSGIAALLRKSKILFVTLGV